MKAINKKTVQGTIFGLLLLILMCLIFYMSAQNGESSSAASSSFIRNFLGSFFRLLHINLGSEKNFKAVEIIVRKLAHFSEYALLGIFSFGFFHSFSMSNKKVFFTSSLFCILYAASDEIHQLFVPERSGQLTDLIIDSTGSLCGIAIFILSLKLMSFLQAKNSGRHS